MKTKHSLNENFRFAFDGVKTAINKGRNIKIMIIIGLAAIFLGMVLKIKASEWVGLVLIICTVLGLEMINTAIEAVVDLVSPDYNEKAKIAKDVAAGAVLTASIASVAIGALIFLPKILNF